MDRFLRFPPALGLFLPLLLLGSLVLLGVLPLSETNRPVPYAHASLPPDVHPRTEPAEFVSPPDPYPIDGYELTGIRRLARLQLIQEGTLSGTLPPPGSRKSFTEIRLHLVGADSVSGIPESTPDLQSEIAALFRGRSSSYGLAMVDITPGAPMRAATYQATGRYQPGSVGKIAIAAGFLNELQRRYPDRPAARRELLKTHVVEAGEWVVPNHHEIPVFDPEMRAYSRRSVRTTDRFSLYEWLDHMLSASSNAAASVTWKEAVLMRAFGDEYPVSPEREAEFFNTTPRAELGEMGFAVVHDALREASVPEDALRIGSLFTSTASRRIPVPGGSHGTPQGLLTFLIRLEQGRIVDRWSSLELKRLLYLTDRRIRYASAPALSDAAVYFKSGSLYSCRAEDGFSCGKYRGNVYNYMNSIAIVEPPDGRVYLVALMSNVLKVNSAVEHQSLATFIERVDAKVHASANASAETGSGE